TGVLQSALGNLPELFIAFFALRAGLLSVVQAAIIGSILANLLLVLGAAFIVGGLKHGTQRFSAGPARTNVVLLALATAALVLPSFAAHTNSPATHHLTALSATRCAPSVTRTPRITRDTGRSGWRWSCWLRLV